MGGDSEEVFRGEMRAYVAEMRRDEKHVDVLRRLDAISAAASAIANQQLVLANQLLEHERRDSEYHAATEDWQRNHETTHHTIVEKTFDDVTGRHELAAYKKTTLFRRRLYTRAVMTIVGSVAVAIASWLTHGAIVAH